MGYRRTLALAVCIIISSVTHSSAQIYVADSAPPVAVTKIVRVSVKIMNDAQDRRPVDGHYHTPEQILTVFDECNATLSAMGADWRLELTEIQDVRGASDWFGPFDCDLKRQFEAEASADPQRFFYRANAINIFVINELIGCGGYSSVPTSGDETIIINNRVGILNWSLGWLHEIGHYFGLQHTYQCRNRPCQSDLSVCTGVGSEFRDCPDACPDTNNLMSAHGDLLPGVAVFSPCQLSEIARTMRPGDGWRAKVVEYVGPAGPSSGGCEPTGLSAEPAADDQQSQTPVVVNSVGIPISNWPGASSDSSSNTTAQDSTESTVGSTCQWELDLTPPIVSRIDPQLAPGSSRVNGVVIKFSEPMDATQVSNGLDVIIAAAGDPIDGAIAWRDDDQTLAWTATSTLLPGDYGVYLTSNDESGVRDRAGNTLVSNFEGYFAVSFALDSQGQLVPPGAGICGTGAGTAGAALLTMITASRQRRRRRGSPRRP